jgi:outer membrane lipoprotein SlyB
MKNTLSTLLIGFALLFASAGASAQEMSVRKGVVTSIAPIQVDVQSQPPKRKSATGGALGRSLGRVFGRAASRATGGHSYEAYDVASSATRDVADSVTSGAGPDEAQKTTAYMVMIRFDDGTESAIQTAEANGLAVGGRVNVFGSGASAQVVPGE